MGKTQRNLHKFRFYYNSDSFSHVYFKNKRKSTKIKKKKISEKRNLNIFNVKKQDIQLQTFNKNITKPVNRQTQKNGNSSYAKKLEKIKSERKIQIERKFKKDHQNAMK